MPRSCSLLGWLAGWFAVMFYIPDIYTHKLGLIKNIAARLKGGSYGEQLT